MHYPPTLTQIPRDLVSLSDYERYAKRHLSDAIFSYISGGGADEITLKRNREILDQYFIQPRVLQDVTKGTTATRILGEAFRHPILLAPVAFQKIAHPEGELATATAASLLETGMVVSTLASESIENIAQTLKSPKWFQLYFQQSKTFTLELIKRAEAAGYTALIVTVDAPLHGIRNRAQRAGFELPQGIEAVNLRDRPPLPEAILDPNESIIFQGMMTEVPSWEELKWLIANTQLPIILKGVLHPADALRAKEMGVSGVVVSNHGGRALDCVPTSIEMLPIIRSHVGDDFLLLMDGAIERGTDVFKAIALGADAVMIGRPQIYALAVAGSLGVAHMLRIIREELEVTMALAGTSNVSDIRQAILWQGGFQRL